MFCVANFIYNEFSLNREKKGAAAPVDLISQLCDSPFVYIRGFNLSEGQAEQMKSAGNENRVIRDFYKLLLQNNDKIG